MVNNKSGVFHDLFRRSESEDLPLSERPFLEIPIRAPAPPETVDFCFAFRKAKASLPIPHVSTRLIVFKFPVSGALAVDRFWPGQSSLGSHDPSPTFP